MRRFIILSLSILSLLALFTLASPGADARRREHFQPLPYPDLLYPAPPLIPPGGFVMNVAPATEAQNEETRRTLREIDRPRDVAKAIVACWKAPAPLDDIRQEVTVRLSFSRDGRVIGEPRVAYVNLPASDGRRETLVRSIRDAIAACTPLRFTKGMASAIAGRIFAIRFAVNRRGEVNL